MFKFANTAKTRALCTLPLFALCLISSCSHKSVLLLQPAYTSQYILQYVDVKFSVQNLRKFTSYRKISKISPSKYKPPKPVTQKPSVKSPLKYKPPGGLYLENCPQIQSKTKQKR